MVPLIIFFFKEVAFLEETEHLPIGQEYCMALQRRIATLLSFILQRVVHVLNEHIWYKHDFASMVNVSRQM